MPGASVQAATPGAVLVLASTQSPLTRAQAAIGTLVGPTTVRENLQGIPLLSGYSFIVADIDALPDADVTRLTRFCALESRTRLVILSAQQSAAVVARFNNRPPLNLVGKADNGEELPELLATIRKLRHQEIFGLTPYFEPKAISAAVVVSNPVEKGEALKAAETFARSRGARARIVNQFVTCVDELLLMVFPPSSVPRPLGLPSRGVELSFAWDGRMFAGALIERAVPLAPSDLPSVVVECCAEARTTSARVTSRRYHALFRAASHLVINVSTTKVITETIAMISATDSRDLAARPRSLNVFVEAR